MKNIIISFISVILFFACNPEKVPINYGQDKCSYCRMSIVEHQFAGEIVTTKGKVFKFDAVECMANYLAQNNLSDADLAMVLTNTFDHPNTFQNAHECYFLQSKNMPSPMGMFLNPFKDKDEVTKIQQENGGKIMTWNDLKVHLAMN